MKMSVIQNAMETLQSELSETVDLEEVSFFEGAFSVLSKQRKNGTLDRAIFHEYLSDFVREGGIEQRTLEMVNPQLLEDLEDMLEEEV